MSVFTSEHDDLDTGRTVAWLHELEEPVVDRVGAKAANLAIAHGAGLEVVPGFAVPTHVAARLAGSDLDPLREAWGELSDGGRQPVVVRSSSPVEDAGTSSLAGVFDSVVGVEDWPSFISAFEAVVASGGGGPMAVLVQRHLDPTLGGVLFGVDPASGRSDRRVVAAVHGGPWQLVSGEVNGRRTILTPTGRIVATDGDEQPVLRRGQLRELVRLEARASARFGGPQDIEWAFEGDRLWLLQSRPITSVAEVADGPRFGPGPVAETFPEPLSRLEADLWIGPLREAIAVTLELTGSASRRRLARSPVVRLVHGRAVADLDLIEGPARRGLLDVLDPRPRLRRLAAAWRMGRLRAGFPSLADRLLTDLDRALGQVPPLAELTDHTLLHVLDNTRWHLVAVHGHELLAARLGQHEGATGAEAALHALAEGRRREWSDDDILARRPVVLSLLAPRIGERGPLPQLRTVPAWVDDVTSLSEREALRLRARWLHELASRVALELGGRLAERGVLATADDVNGLDLDELRAAVAGDMVPLEVVARGANSPPLPAVFRLTPSGRVVSERANGGPAIGASGGRATGRVSHRDPNPGEILVVRTLDPSLAPVLPDLAGLVAETGSPLSHLAILAREYGVPTVVGVVGACERYEVGVHVLVDGTSGEVEILEESDVG